MKKTFKGGISAMVAVLLAASLLVMGCATKGGSGTPPTPDKLAVQLAADINAIRAGSATADGDTVRLTNEVYLKTGLTVPAGVTLDLTADKVKFELQNGATLTVDGTVNTSGEGFRLGEGTAVITGNGTINLKSKGILLNIGGKKHLTLDGVTLVGLPDNDNSLVQVSDGGEFVLKSGAIRDNSNHGVQVNENGIFTMKGGEISGNMGRRGGGVSVYLGTFTKTDGIIYGDTDTIHTPGSLENTALTGAGHAVLIVGSSGNLMKCNDTADPEIKLYAKYANGVWTYNDTSVGGVGDTTANWISD